LVSVPMKNETSFGDPVILFQLTATPPRGGDGLGDYYYDVAKNGEQFLVSSHLQGSFSGSIKVQLNWPASLKR
jgi:hypothetical protein